MVERSGSHQNRLLYTVYKVQLSRNVFPPEFCTQIALIVQNTGNMKDFQAEFQISMGVE